MHITRFVMHTNSADDSCFSNEVRWFTDIEAAKVLKMCCSHILDLLILSIKKTR